MAPGKYVWLAFALLSFPRTLAAAEPPNAESKRVLDQCNADSEAAQRQRKAGKLLAARDAFRGCARPECPAAIATFCSGRFAEVEAALPTLVLRVRDGTGADLADLDVWINGARAGKSDGRAIAVDPGPNAIRVTRPSTGVSAATSVVVLEGEKLRPITIALSASNPAAPPSAPSPPNPEPKPAPSHSPGALPFILGGLGVVSIGSGALLWASGLSDRSSELEPSGCAPRCSDSVKDSIRTKLLIGDGLALLGIVSVGIATYLFLKPAPSHDGAAIVRVRARR
jgi:hypothetical protein